MISAHLPPGTKIECIAWTRANRRWRGANLVIGRVYTLRQTRICPETNRPGVLLEEHRNPVNRQYKLEYGYRLECFRVVEEPKQSVHLPESITRLLNVNAPHELERV
jgi:hypothetical protein